MGQHFVPLDFDDSTGNQVLYPFYEIIVRYLPLRPPFGVCFYPRGDLLGCGGLVDLGWRDLDYPLLDEKLDPLCKVRIPHLAFRPPLGIVSYPTWYFGRGWRWCGRLVASSRGYTPRICQDCRTWDNPESRVVPVLSKVARGVAHPCAVNPVLMRPKAGLVAAVPKVPPVPMAAGRETRLQATRNGVISPRGGILGPSRGLLRKCLRTVLQPRGQDNK